MAETYTTPSGVIEKINRFSIIIPSLRDLLKVSNGCSGAVERYCKYYGNGSMNVEF